MNCCWKLSSLRIGGWPHGTAFRSGAGPASLMIGLGKEGVSVPFVPHSLTLWNLKQLLREPSHILP